MENRITIHICTRDRHTELALLLQSLRTQTYQNFDILICDDASGSPIISAGFITALITRLKLENHKIKLIRNGESFGCCYARNRCIEEDKFDNPLTFRCDDDVILETDYIEKLMVGIMMGYDMVTGVIPLLGHPEIKRKVEFVIPIINKKEFNDKGDLIRYEDSCGYCYSEDKVILTSEFRTNCLYKSEINKKVKYPINLTTVSFREEAFFSTESILLGYKIAVVTGAISYHLQTPSGGNRCPDYTEKVKIDDETYRKWMKKQFQKHGNFFKKYYENIHKRPYLGIYNTEYKKGKTLEQQHGKEKADKIRKANSEGHKGDKNPAKRPEVREKLSGKNCHFWKGGISYEEYGKEFSEELKTKIRKRDKFVCQTCGKNGFIVHHIDYDKKNNKPENLITLCNSCHCKTNFKREDWTKFFQIKVKEIYKK